MAYKNINVVLTPVSYGQTDLLCRGVILITQGLTGFSNSSNRFVKDVFSSDVLTFFYEFEQSTPHNVLNLIQMKVHCWVVSINCFNIVF